MKILILSKKFPYPLREGEPIAITYLSRSLAAKGCEVTLLAMNTSKHYFNVAHLPKNYDHFKAIHTVDVDNRISPVGALKSLLKGKSYILSRFYSENFAEKLVEILKAESFDVVQLETVYLAHYIPFIRRHSDAIVSMRAHNVEHEIWQRFAANAPFFLKKWYLLNQNKNLRRFEIELLCNYDVLAAITARDLDVFRKLGFRNEGVVAPVGINLKEYQPDISAFQKKISFAFIGALDWMPNQEGVVWFLEKVWPAVLKKHPEVELHIAGINAPAWLTRKKQPGVFFHGEIPDAKAFLNEHPMMIAPLFSGSGIKIKVLEGMALGRVVLTTPVGTEGIPAKHGEQLFVASTPEEFLRNLDFCMENEEALPHIGQQARAFIGEHFDNLEIAENLLRTYERLLKEKEK